jgi:hypothetical protein
MRRLELSGVVQQLERADAVEGIPREALSPDGRFLAPMPHSTHTDDAEAPTIVE